MPFRDAIRLLLPVASVILEFLRFKAERIIGNPSVVPAAKLVSLRVILAQRASIVAPGRSKPFNADSSATHVLVGGSAFPYTSLFSGDLV